MVSFSTLAVDPNAPPPPPPVVRLSRAVFGLPLRLDILQTVRPTENQPGAIVHTHYTLHPHVPNARPRTGSRML